MKGKIIITKTLSAVLTATLTLTNFLVIATHMSEVHATEGELENQNVKIQGSDVEFDAYFKDKEQTITHSLKQDIDEETNLYLSIDVKKGYVKGARIEIKGEDGEEANFKIKEQVDTEDIKGIDSQNNTIELNQMNNQIKKEIAIPVINSREEKYKIENLNKTNDIKIIVEYVTNGGKTKEVENTIKVNMEWTKEANVEVKQEVKMFIPYEVENEKGTILQTEVEAGIENNSLPERQLDVYVKVPEVEGKLPKEIMVRKDEAGEETQEETTYDEEQGIIKISKSNEIDEEGKVTWKDTQNKYILTYKYEDKVKEIDVGQKAVGIASIYGTNEIKNEINEIQILEEAKKGEMVTVEEVVTEMINKGHLYNATGKEEKYRKTQKINVVYKDLIDEIKIEEKEDKFVGESETKVATSVGETKYTQYKKTSINKAEMLDILGESGYITIKEKSGEELYKITKDTQENEEGKIEYTYEKELSELVIELSKPVKEGIIEIEHEKVLKGNIQKSKEEVKKYTKLETDTKVTGTKEELNVLEVESINEINLQEPKTKIEATINNSNLTTKVKNENIEMRVILTTNNVTCDLYKDPEIEVVLPKEVKTIDLKRVYLSFDEELAIDTYEKETNSEGNIVIKIKLTGEQTKYNEDNITNGANVIIDADIELKETAPNQLEKIEVYVKNENVTTYEKEKTVGDNEVRGYTDLEIQEETAVEFLAMTIITGYNANNDILVDREDENTVGKLDISSETRRATVTMSITNNCVAPVTEVSLIGIFPFAGNMGVIDGEDLGSDTSAKLMSKITYEGIEESNVKIYYTENKYPVTNIDEIAGEWKQDKDVESIENITKWYIKLEDYSMPVGTTITFKYEIEIPSDLGFNSDIYMDYVANYTENTGGVGEGTRRYKHVTTQLSTGNGPLLNVNLQANVISGEEVPEGKIITYKVTIENAGSDDAKNVKISGVIPEGTTYVEITNYEGYGETEYYPNEKIKNFEKTYETINIGQTIVFEYSVKVNELTENEELNIEEYVTVTADKIVEGIESNRITNKIVKGFLDLSISRYPDDSGMIFQEGYDVTYIIKVKNVNSQDKTNVNVNVTLPEGLVYTQGYINREDRVTEGVTYNVGKRTVNWDIGTIKGDSTGYITLMCTIDKFKQGETKKEIAIYAMATCSEATNVAVSDDFIINAGKPLIVASMTSNREGVTITDVDAIEYYITLRNVGGAITGNIQIKDWIPEGLLYLGTEYTVNGQEFKTKNGSDMTTLTLNIDVGKEALITIKAKAKKLAEDVDQIEIENKAVIVQADGEEIVLTPIKNTIVKAPESDPGIDPGTTNTYSISGIAWIDENLDGKRDNSEPVLNNVEVMLINTNTGAIVKDEIGNQRVLRTNEVGKYEFNGLDKGNYRVVFLYDVGTYDVTTYNKEGLKEHENSDAISMTIKINGEERKGAVSENITLSNENIYNIDIGLIVNKKFDLKLDKVITKITLNTSKKATVHEYKNSKLAKLDIPSKEIKGSQVVIEYKIRVTNEGGIGGYAKKIVDYIPNGLNFSSNINEGWYEGEGGKVYNTTLSNTEIQPGETKEITLILTKQMTGENTGIINNNAELAESYNVQGLSDVDSVAGNNANGEDDKSNADAIIGVRTGEVIIYSTITMISVFILGVGIYLLKKKVIGTKEKGDKN